jgi:hypothetical protein
MKVRETEKKGNTEAGVMKAIFKAEKRRDLDIRAKSRFTIRMISLDSEGKTLSHSKSSSRPCQNNPGKLLAVPSSARLLWWDGSAVLLARGKATLVG